MIKIAIADDHQLMLNTLKRLFSEEKDISVTSVASTYSQITKMYYSNDWDILILDIMMPVKNGFEIFNELKQQVPTAKVIFLSNLKDEEIIFKAEILGADGFVQKSNAPYELIKAVRTINKGEKYFNRVA
jgi:DNA-binding NarL/FixJ family response regulator